MFNATWADSFAFTADETGLPVCLICYERLANNKKSNVPRHFQNKHAAFAQKYSDGDEWKSRFGTDMEGWSEQKSLQEVDEVSSLKYIC